MSPAVLFSLALLVTGLSALGDFMIRRRREARLRSLAAEWDMNYSPRDQFRLTQRIARIFPIPGAARIRIVNLIYGIDSDLYRYIFTAEYTTGIVTGKRRILRAGSFSEPRDRSGETPQTTVTLAPGHLPLIEQYRRLTPPNAKTKGSGGARPV
jgi:hypothetical protein